MTTAVLDAFKEADVCIVNVPANITKYYEIFHNDKSFSMPLLFGHTVEKTNHQGN